MSLFKKSGGGGEMFLKFIIGIAVLGGIVFVAWWLYNNSGGSAIGGVFSSVGTAVQGVGDLVKTTTSTAGNIITSTPIALAAKAIANAAKPCGSKSRGDKTSDPEGTACSFPDHYANPNLCYLHVRNGVWTCDESCFQRHGCCYKWWHDGKCTKAS